MDMDEVYEKLSLVYDPELDQSLIELDFIQHVQINNGQVTVAFRLPTYWCSPNFAFLMAMDIRNTVAELPWVTSVYVELIEHSDSIAINAGINQGRSFQETFPEISNEELDNLRMHFRRKAFISRQERLYRALIAEEQSINNILALTIQDLRTLPYYKKETMKFITRYINILDELQFDTSTEAPVFIKLNGQKIKPSELNAYMAESRKTRIAQEFNGVYCRGLLQTRYNTDASKQMEGIKP